MKDLIETIQHNCNIADAQSAGNYTLCIYLLKMRELFRWEKQEDFDAALENDAIGNWITEREQLWLDLEHQDYQPLAIKGKTFLPFENDDINKAILSDNLVYSGGLGQHETPHFFIAELIQKTEVDDYRIYIAGKEFARDLTAPPAMSLGKNIFIRKESLKRMIWERLEEWRWKRGSGAMSKALEIYDFDNQLHQSLDEMTNHESDVLLHHEIGEILAGRHLGEGWHEMLYSLPRSAGEFMARAVRDHLADCTSTLPMLLNEKRHASLHFFFGNFNGMRREIFPGLFQAYEQWQSEQNDEELRDIIVQGQTHWHEQAHNILEIYHSTPENCASQIVEMINCNKL